MRKLLLGALLPLTLAGCAGLGSLPTVPPAPVEVANRTAADEQAAQGAELSYKAFRTALEIATDAGLLKGAAATKAANLDNRAYAALLAARAAYRTANSADYLAAVGTARAAIDAALAAVKGK